MPIRIPIIRQDTSTPFVPQQSRQAIQIDDPRGRALQGLGQGIGDFGDGLSKSLKRQSTDTAADRDDADLGQVMRNNAAALAADSAATTDRDDVSGAATWRTSVLETQRQQNLNSWILRAYADTAGYGDQLANHLDPGAPPPAAPAGSTASSAGAGDSGAAATSAAPATPNPANLLQNFLRGSALGGLIGGAAGNVGSPTPGSPADPAANDPSPTDPAVHGHTGAWLNGYDASARATIAAAPDKAARQSLIQQFGADRTQGAQALMLREAQANLERRQSGYLADIQRIATTQVSANPESLPRILDLVERHPIRAAGEQSAFDAQVRQTLVGAAMGSLIARDPQGVVDALQDRATPADAGDSEAAAPDEAASVGSADAPKEVPSGDTPADHPVYALLTPQERGNYLRQAESAVCTAQSNAQADVLQQSDAAIRGARAGNPPATAPARDAFVRAFGEEQGAQRFDAMQQALTGQRWRNTLLPLPGPRLSAAVLTNASPQFREIVRQIQEERRQSPIDAAMQAGGYRLQPIAFAPEASGGTPLGQAIAARAAVAGTIASAYDTLPVLFSRDEVARLAATLQGQKPEQQQDMLRQLQQSTANPGLHETTLRALSAHAPVIALAGLHMAADEEDEDDTGLLASGNSAMSSWGGSGKVDAADLLLRGNALLQPPEQEQGKAAEPSPMPPMQELWHSFAEFTGGALASRPGQEAMEFQGARAVLAAMRWQEGDRSTILDPGQMQEATYIARFGSVPIRELALLRSDNSLQPTNAQFEETPAANHSPLMNVGYFPAGQGLNAASTLFPNLIPHDLNSPAASTASPQPGTPPIAPIDRSAAAAKQQSFVTGLQNLLTTRQVGVPASYTQDEADTQFQLSLGARQQLRDAGQWVSQDPARGNAILQGALQALLSPDSKPGEPQQPLVGDDLKATLKSAGKRTSDAFYTVAGLVDLLQHGDPTKPDVARQIGAGLAFVTAPENARFAPGLLLGMLSANGSPSPAIDKILKASEQIAPEDRSAYNWQALTKDQLIAPITTLVEAGARAAMGSGPVGRVFGSFKNSLAEMGQQAISSANKAGQQIKGSISEMGQRAGDAIRGGMGPQLAGAGAGAGAAGTPANTQAGPKQGPMMASGTNANSSGSVGGKATSATTPANSTGTPTNSAPAPASSGSGATTPVPAGTRADKHYDAIPDADFAAATDPNILSQLKTDHVLKGDVKKDGQGNVRKVTGGHSLVEGTVQTVGPETPLGSRGVYQAKVQVKDPQTGLYHSKTNGYPDPGDSTLYPKHWTRDRINFEVAKAFSSKPPPTAISNSNAQRWVGMTPSGVGVKGVIEGSGKVTHHPTKRQQ